MGWTEVTMVGLAAGMATLLALLVARVSVRTSLAVGVVLVLWLLGVALLARTGALEAWSARPPRLVLLPLTVLATGLVVRRTAAFRAVSASIPPAWIVGAQTFRVGVELVLYGLHVAGRAPVQVTFAGRNVDVLVGLSAPALAWAMARGRVAPRAVVAWNVLGLAVLANTVFTVVTSTPGPLHLAWPGAPFTELARWPSVWLPGFLAPLAVFLHGLSLQQHLPLLRRRAVGAPS